MQASVTIWGRPSSINVRKVAWAAQETGVAFERIDAGAAFGLMPADMRRRFVAEQWMDWQQTTLNRTTCDAIIELIRTAADKRQHALIEQSAARTAPLLDLLEAHLAQSAFLAGDAFSMADIAVGCEIHRWSGLPPQHPPRPHLQRWYAALQARPASRGVLDQELS